MVHAKSFRGALNGIARLGWRTIPLSWRINLHRRWRNRPFQEHLTAADKAELVKALRPANGAEGGRRLWFLPTHTWFSPAFQRPQQLAIALSEVGCKVIYWEPWDIMGHLRTAASDRERRFVGLRQLSQNLWLLRCIEEDYVELLAASQPEWLLFFWPTQTRFIPADCRSRTIYEMIDDHSLEGVDESWQRTHETWLQRADVVVGTADDLVAQLRPLRADALLVSNGVRVEDWSRNGNTGVPPDLAPARARSVVVGYYGAIAEWLDFDMWLAAARSRPDWAFVWVGYPYNHAMQQRIERELSLPNTFYLGRKSYLELPAYLAHFDVATIPFLLNPITHSCSPVKLFEFMAAGKPIVATRMREILKYRSVLFADTAAGFVEQIERALTLRDDSAYRRLLREEAEANTWRGRARTLCAAMDRAENAPA